MHKLPHFVRKQACKPLLLFFFPGVILKGGIRHRPLASLLIWLNPHIIHILKTSKWLSTYPCKISPSNGIKHYFKHHKQLQYDCVRQQNNIHYPHSLPKQRPLPIPLVSLTLSLIIAVSLSISLTFTQQLRPSPLLPPQPVPPPLPQVETH